MTLRLRWLAFAASAVLLALSAAETSAQQRPVPQRADTSAMRVDPRLMQRGSVDPDVLERLRASGLTRQQVRAELQRRGYDPSLADPYFDALERGGSGRPGSNLMDALVGAGMAGDSARAGRDSAGLNRWGDLDLLDIERLLGLTGPESLASAELQVFGSAFFGRTMLLDDPAFGPVEANYRLGPGDEVNVVLTGAVQDVYPLRISREGTLIVPDVGEIVANGLSIAGLEDLLRARFGAVHASGLTRVSVSLGRVRTIQVNVVGDVERPGPHQISAAGTLLSALYRAGGPSRTGSFREIEVRRGTTVVHRMDLYDYLLHGNSQADTRLQHGDVLFVPPVARRVRLEGAVRRPALYELREGDGLRDALRFAGGPEADAALQSVRIDRVVPPAQRTPGTDRIVLTVDAQRLLASNEPDVMLYDGDRVHVHAVSDERRNSLVVSGEVRRPGVYGWAPGITLADVVEQAAGLTEAAFVERAHIFRLDPLTGERHLVPGPLAGDEARLTRLEDRDSVVVYNRDRLRDREFVTVGGLVRRPGRYPLFPGTTVQDIVLAAGGYADGAWQAEAYVGRPTLGDTVAASAHTYRVPIAAHDPANGIARGDNVPFVLRHGDRVEIRRTPGYELPRTVVIAGEVTLPGAYVLESRDHRVSALLQSAGGFTGEARPDGVHVIRDGRTLAVDVTRALTGTGSASDLVLEDGDTIRVPRFDPTILVTGAIVHDSTRVLYRPGMSVNDVVREAGGFARDADRRRLTVTYQNGVRRAVQNLPLLPDRRPHAEPGSTIYVPELPPGARDGINWGTLISQLVGAAGAVATILIAVNR
jgi:polysaccharide biosynthesis/export protein